MVALLLRHAARRGHSCPWDGASTTFSTPDTRIIQDTRQLPQQAPAQYHLAREALRRAARTQDRAPTLIATCESLIARPVAYSREHLEDPPEIRDWIWTDA